MKRWINIIILVVIAGLALFGYHIYSHYRETATFNLTRQAEDYWKQDSYLTKLELFGDENQFVSYSVVEGEWNKQPLTKDYIVTLKYYYYFPDEYTIGLSSSLPLEPDTTSPLIGPEEHHDILIYNVEDGIASPRTVDLLKLANQDSSIPYRLKRPSKVGTRIVTKGDKSYFVEEFFSIKDGEVYTKIVTVDLETGELGEELTEDEVLSLPTNNTLVSSGLAWKRGRIQSSLYSDFEMNNAIAIEISTGIISIGEEYNLHDTNFSKLYPKIDEELRGNYSTIYLRADGATDAEFFDLILHWFAPEGQDAIKIYAQISDSEEKTLITSSAEYANWLETHPVEE